MTNKAKLETVNNTVLHFTAIRMFLPQKCYLPCGLDILKSEQNNNRSG